MLAEEMADSNNVSGDRACPSPSPSASSSKSPEPEESVVAELAEKFSKLDPSAKEFIPVRRGPSLSSKGKLPADAVQFMTTRNLIGGGSYDADNRGSSSNQQYRRRNRGGHGWVGNITGRHRVQDNYDTTKRTIYVSQIDHFVSEEEIAAFFSRCGRVEDCRICGDPYSELRFAFVEFANRYGASAALNLNGIVPWSRPLKILPSRTSISPVNTSFIPRSAGEREKCVKTIYVNNIDKKVSLQELKFFFSSSCGEIARMRLLPGPANALISIAFIEFIEAQSAIIALERSGMALGDHPIRVSPSKTTVKFPDYMNN
ncbi:polyadenylate-binding protein-interacting protein 9-like [Canna indica]|uniref:Polyadenylate-binding protein-interacting protein 9-like n=1 Tax=Canna indica TaxID=4628 RepID=A0AAQ3JKR6_9LILI|nr:polyadenylate-binding protein-interacting protein 9-like [Canna indica]